MKKATAALVDLIQRLQPRQETTRALLGLPGTTTVEVPNRDGYVYAREMGGSSRVLQVYNGRVFPQYDLPVVIGEDPVNPGKVQILDIDIAAFESWRDRSALEAHHKTHEYGSRDSDGVRIDSDVVFVQSRQIVPLSIRPQTTEDMTIYAEPGWYRYGEYHRLWPGDISKTFVAPVEVGVAVFELVYIDVSTGYLGYARGSEFVLSQTMDFEEFTPDIPWGAGAIGCVLLQYGQTEITHDDIIDVRELMNVPGGPIHLSEGLTVTGNIIITGGGIDLYDSYLDAGVTALSRLRLPRGTGVSGWDGLEGEIAWDTGFKKLYIHNGSLWREISLV